MVSIAPFCTETGAIPDDANVDATAARARCRRFSILTGSNITPIAHPARLRVR
jgi:hypothetical protein